jgi:hypothetical protein
MKIALTRVASFESIAPSDKGKAQDGEKKRIKGGFHALDNPDHPVHFMGSGTFRVPRRRPYPRSSGHCRDRSDRTTITGPTSFLAEKTAKREGGYRRNRRFCLSASGRYFLEENLRGSPSLDLI